jgi:hypothetical protein
VVEADLGQKWTSEFSPTTPVSGDCNFASHRACLNVTFPRCMLFVAKALLIWRSKAQQAVDRSIGCLSSRAANSLGGLGSCPPLAAWMPVFFDLMNHGLYLRLKNKERSEKEFAATANATGA